MSQVFFIHIPRTGGGSLEKPLAFRFNNVAPRHSWTQDPGLPDVRFHDYDLIIGHYPYSFGNRLDDPIIFTMLRDPVARVLSHYSYVKQYGYHHDPAYTEFMKTASIQDWLDSDYSARAANNLQTRFFCDRIDDDLDRALRHLERIDWVGIFDDPHGLQENLDGFLRLIDKGIVPVEGRYNASDHPILLSELDATLLLELQQRNAKDLALYYSAKEQMAELRAEYV